MRRLLLTGLLLFLSVLYAAAQDLWLYSVNGHVEVRSLACDWKDAGSGISALSLTDSLRIGDNSSVTILDRSAEKVYALQAAGENEVRNLVNVARKRNEKSSKGLISFLWNSFRGDDSADNHRRSAGVVYRDDDINYAIAASILEGKGALNVSLMLIDNNGDSINHHVTVGELAYLKVSNNTGQSLFVNLFDIDADGQIVNCTPTSSSQEMAKLLIPPYSEVILNTFPIVFGYPLGTDRLVLVACQKVFDADRVIECIRTQNFTTGSLELGIDSMSVRVSD